MSPQSTTTSTAEPLHPQQAPADFQHWFHHVAPYINSHRGKTFVISLPGEGLQKIHLASFVADMALLQSLGVRLVLVFGCRPQIDSALAKQQQPPGTSALINGVHVTDAMRLDLYLQACGKALAQLSAASLGLPHSPMHGAAIEVLTGNWVTAQPYGIHNGIDFQFTGKVRKIDVKAMHAHLSAHRLLILPPMGYSPTGECFNLCHDQLSLNVACQLKADKLIILTPFDGLEDGQQNRIREVQLPSRDQLYFNTPAMEHIFNLATQACEQKVNRVHLVSFQGQGNLLQELFTREGSGTMITAHRIEKIRTARMEDVSIIFELTAPLEAQGVLITRSRDVIEKDIEKFSVIERDNSIIGCGALYDYPQAIGELACIAVNPEYRGQKKGMQLIHNLVQKAKYMGLKGVFILTTQASHWFQEQGFKPADQSVLPQERQASYDTNRNAKILFRPL